MSENSIISLEQVGKTFGSKTVLENLSLNINQGRFYSLVGESGSGKTTTLRLMNGLEQPSSGIVRFKGEPLNYRKIIPVRRSMGYCLQGYTLFPHMTIEDNITIVAQKSGWSKKRQAERVDEVMDLMGLDPEQYLDKMPNHLSGGQRQRVGIARAIFMNPSILLMDEPFGALDPITRNELQDAFIELQKKLELSVVLVTHDLSEAFKMSHEIMILNQGQLAQQGKPNTLLTKPADDYVESFLKTNSPGHILKEVPIYSVLYSDIWMKVPANGNSNICLRNRDTGSERKFESEEQMLSFLRDQSQKIAIEIDGDENLVSARDIRQDKAIEHSIRENTDLLSALQTLTRLEANTVPVVDQYNRVIGVFGREALDVIG